MPGQVIASGAKPAIILALSVWQRWRNNAKYWQAARFVMVSALGRQRTLGLLYERRLYDRSK